MQEPLIKLEICEDTILSNETYEDNTLIDLKEIEFEMIAAIDYADKRKIEIYNSIAEIDERLVLINQKVEELNKDIDRLTNYADGLDCTIAVTCGLIAGTIDAVFIGEWNFEKAKAISNEKINHTVIEFAKKHPDYEKFIVTKKGTVKYSNRLANAIEFLEGKYKLPGDGAYNFKGSGITHSTHHLDDFCHHPTLIGLICCIIVQFTGTVTYRSSTGVVKVPIEVNEYGKFASEEKWGKVFAGIINWFFNVAQAKENWKGHLMSDIAGSAKSVGKGNDGTGLPGSFLSIAKELSTLPCFKNTNFSENLRKSFQNGIGADKSKFDIGSFNSLFNGASSKFDMRTEMAVKHELERQAVPIIVAELLARGAYFIRAFIRQMKAKNSILDLDWYKTLPFRNRTVVRMITIATGTFTAIDLGDAFFQSLKKSGGFNYATPGNFILRVNFVGVGRFAIAVSSDVGMAMKKSKNENSKMHLKEEKLQRLNAKVFYKEADMWIEAENTDKAIEKVYVAMKKAAEDFANAWYEVKEGSPERKGYIDRIKENDIEFSQELLDIIVWG